MRAAAAPRLPAGKSGRAHRHGLRTSGSDARLRERSFVTLYPGFHSLDRGPPMRCLAVLWFVAATALRAQQPVPPAPDSTRAESTHALPAPPAPAALAPPTLEQQRFLRSEEHTSELQSRLHLVCRLLLEKKKNKYTHIRCT